MYQLGRIRVHLGDCLPRVRAPKAPPRPATDRAWDYLAALIRESGSGWLFPNGVGGHLTAGHVGKLIAAALPGDWTAHTLRHRFATRAYRGSHDLRAVQRLLGHESVLSTERYTAVGDDEVRAAAARAW